MASSAPYALIRPPPMPATGAAVWRMANTICAGVNLGLTLSMSAATPAAAGALTELPHACMYPRPAQ